MVKSADSDQIAKAREPWPSYVSANGTGAIAGVLNLWIRAFESSPSANDIREAAAIVDDLVAHERQAVIEDCCRAVCVLCANPKTYRPARKIGDTWIHHYADIDDDAPCLATAIRSME